MSKSVVHPEDARIKQVRDLRAVDAGVTAHRNHPKTTKLAQALANQYHVKKTWCILRVHTQRGHNTYDLLTPAAAAKKSSIQQHKVSSSHGGLALCQKAWCILRMHASSTCGTYRLSTSVRPRTKIIQTQQKLAKVTGDHLMSKKHSAS